MAKGQSNVKAAEGDVHSPARNTEAKPPQSLDS